MASIAREKNGSRRILFVAPDGKRILDNAFPPAIVKRLQARKVVPRRRLVTLGDAEGAAEVLFELGFGERGQRLLGPVFVVRDDEHNVRA